MQLAFGFAVLFIGWLVSAAVYMVGSAGYIPELRLAGMLMFLASTFFAGYVVHEDKKRKNKKVDKEYRKKTANDSPGPFIQP